MTRSYLISVDCTIRARTVLYSSPKDYGVLGMQCRSDGGEGHSLCQTDCSTSSFPFNSKQTNSAKEIGRFPQAKGKAAQ